MIISLACLLQETDRKFELKTKINMKIALISCVKSKRNLEEGQCIAAKDLYTSALFTKGWAYAQNLKADKVYIISAKYKLLNPEQPIETYDETLLNKPANECKNWASDVLHSLRKKGINFEKDEFVILAGQKYYKYLIGDNGIKHYTLPYQGKRFGEILKFLNSTLK